MEELNKIFYFLQIKVTLTHLPFPMALMALQFSQDQLKLLLSFQSILPLLKYRPNALNNAIDMFFLKT